MVPHDKDTNAPKWSGRHAVVVLAALFVMAWPIGLIEEFFLQVFLQSISMGVLVVLVARGTGATLPELGLSNNKIFKNICTGLAGGIVLFIIVLFLSMLIQYLTGKTPEPQEVVKQLAGKPSLRQLIWPAIVIVITAPIAEELYFRGLIYPVLRARLGVDMAILVSALIFSMVHFSVFGLAPIAIGGAGLAYLFQKSGSLVPAIVAHSTWNALTLLLVYLSREMAL